MKQKKIIDIVFAVFLTTIFILGMIYVVNNLEKKETLCKLTLGEKAFHTTNPSPAEGYITCCVHKYTNNVYDTKLCKGVSKEELKQ